MQMRAKELLEKALQRMLFCQKMLDSCTSVQYIQY